MRAKPPERRRSPRRDDPDLNGRRSEPRAVIGLRAATDTLAGRGSAILVDLSSAGAQLEGQGLPQAGRDVVLTCCSIEIFGTVMWKEAGRCGVLFEENIARPVLASLRDAAWKAAHSRFTDEEIQAASDWVRGLAR